MSSTDDLRLSFFLFRAASGRYEFRGPARLYLDPRFGQTEHHLLEIHEHNHWELTHSTIFGLNQLSLAYALLLARNERQRRRYAECLDITSELSREVYEGCAVYHERATAEATGAEVHPDWFAALGATLYESAVHLFDRFLSRQPFPALLRASLANNVAELALNSAPRFLWRPARLEPSTIAKAVSDRSPDKMLRSLSDCFLKDAEALAAALRRRVLQPVAERIGVHPEALFAGESLKWINHTLSAMMSYRTYTTVRDLALARGIPVFEGDPEAVDLFRYNVWLTWVRGLPGHERMYPNLVKDVATFPGEPDLSAERYDFATFRTAFDPPPALVDEDIKVAEWSPVERALAFAPNPGQRLYVSIAEVVLSPPIADVLDPVPRTGFVSAQREDRSFGSSLATTMSMADGIRRFREETAPRDTGRLLARAGRAVLKPGGGYAWRQVGARYRLDAARDEAAAVLTELPGKAKVLAVRRSIFDLTTREILGVPSEAFGCTVGVLVEESSVYGWGRTLRAAARDGRPIAMHCVLIGPSEAYPVLVALLQTPPERLVFLYSLASVYSFRTLMTMIREKGAFGANVEWVDNLMNASIGIGPAEAGDIVLVCEHLIQRGF
jgi:hypothetical protein